MKTAVIFYSFTGKTRKLAEREAEKEAADLIEIKECRRRSIIGAYVGGSLAARRQRKTEIEAFTINLSEYDRIIVAVPLWAGFPAPAFNNMLEVIPEGKEIRMIVTSGSGNSSGSKEKTIALAAQKGIHVIEYQDIKTSK